MRRTSWWVVVPAAVSLAYAIAVVVAAWQAPEKGFQAFIGHRVIHVEPGGIADRAGLREGDVIDTIDGAPITSTFDYAQRLLDRAPGEHVVLGIANRGAIAITLESSPPPWSALVATLLAAVLLVLGLVARIGRPDDIVARRFYRATVVFAIVYVGALSWAKLLVHPALGTGFLLALFVGPKLSLDLSLDFPHRAGGNRWRRLSLAVAAVLGGTCATALGVAIVDYASGGGDRALPWISACVALQIGVIPIQSTIALWVQVRAQRVATGEARAQLRWLIFGQALCAVPSIAAIPVAFFDLDRFLIFRYQPFVVAVAALWFVAYGFAVLRVRLADVDGLIQSSLGYALTTGAVATVYLAIVLAAGWLTGQLVGDAGPWPHLVAGLTAATLFGPLRRRVSRWVDLRFFRDRHHYVEALRKAGESLALLREPQDLAREAVEQVVAAVRAEWGALYTDGGECAYRVGDGVVAIEVPVGDARLVLGPRKSGDLYSSEDRDLLGALASQLAVALGNARAYGTIATMSRALETQNVEIRELRDKLEDENRFLRARVEAATDGATLVGESKATRDLRETIDRVARSTASVLVLGESGTGKGLLARTLHAHSPRASGPFLHVDCGAIAATIFESELFGHERGAFTGATRLRRGPIELADGGTLFLDEIGELPLELQPKLLRVLEDHSVLRVGATTPVAVDVRIIAATHRKLDELVARGEFREDLYFRLRVVEIVVPPLRARRADIAALSDSVLPRVARRCGRAQRPLGADALAKLVDYSWPGNVRELENVLERALVLGDTGPIAAAEIELSDRAPAIETDAVEPVDRPHDAVMEDIERRRLTQALQAAAGNQSHAAKALGIPRTTLVNKLRRHGLL